MYNGHGGGNCSGTQSLDGRRTILGYVSVPGGDHASLDPRGGDHA